MTSRLLLISFLFSLTVFCLPACEDSSDSKEDNPDLSDGDDSDESDGDDSDEADGDTWPDTEYTSQWPFPVVHTEGNLLKDEYGRTVMLRGINAGGRAKLPPFIPWQGDGNSDDFDSKLSAYMDFPKVWGMNVLRLTVFWEAVEPTRGSYDEAYLNLLEQMMATAQERGLYVFLDFHQDLFSRYLGGSGAPPWALENPPAEPPALDDQSWFMNVFSSQEVQAAFDRFWHNEDGLQDSYVAMVQAVTARLKGYPNLLGVDVMNEPNPGAEGADALNEWYAQKLIPFYKAAAQAVREELPQAVIFAEPSGLEAGQEGGDIGWSLDGLENAVISPHYYYPTQFLLGEYDGNLEALREALTTKHELTSLGAPVLMSEFGFRGSESEPGDDANAGWFIHDFYKVLDELAMPATVWTHEVSRDAMWNQEDCSFVNGDWTERGPRADAVARPYAEFVNGEVKEFLYRAEEQTVMLRYLVSEDIRQPSVLRVPLRHLSEEEPEVSLTFGKSRWIADKGLLLIYENLGDGPATAGVEQLVSLQL